MAGNAVIALSVACANAMAFAFVDEVAGGALEVYGDNTAAPARPDDPFPDGVVVLGRWRLPVTDTAEVSGGVATFNIPDATPWLASGRVGWARVVDAGAAGVMQPNVGLIDEALVLSSLDAVEGELASIVEWSFAVPTIAES